MRLATLFILTSLIARAQFTYTISQDIPVISGSDTLSLALAGGFNAAQFNTMDLNGDGLEDLVIFDRMAGRVVTYLNNQSSYRYHPEYEVFFPIEVSGFMLLRDFNCDGNKDLFTKDLLGIRVFKNITVQGQPPAWEPVLFYTGFPGPKSDVILTLGFSGKINLQLQPDDMPALLDADGDGDLDIMNVKFVGTSTIEFHKNFSKERYGTCDSLDFVRITQTWGDVEECSCGDFAFFGNSCSASGGRIKHAGGKSLLVIDIDHDNDLDVLYSESECTRVYQLTNTGDKDNPLITEARTFPPETPVNILPFPSVYFEDVDFDGKRDLLASPNIFVREYFSTNLKQSAWFYKNTGTNEAPAFTFQKRNFLQEEMIDVGDQSVPALYDADGDGDLDLFIGSFATDGLGRGSIFYYDNVGTRTEPAYELITEDLYGLSFYGFTNIKPQFFDMNGDGKTDLVFTASNRFGVGTNLYFVPNQNNIGLNFQDQSVTPLNFPIFAGENVTIAYINDDKLPDILLGKQNGSVQYWQNTGIPDTPVFTLANSEYLGLGPSVLRQFPTTSIGDLNGDGRQDMILADQTGTITIIDNFKQTSNAGNGIRDVIFNSISQSYTSMNLGGRIWTTVANLYSMNKPAIIVGNVLGGLHVLKHDGGQVLPEKPTIDIFPNPISTSQIPYLSVRLDRPAIARVFTITGQYTNKSLEMQGQQVYELPVDDLSPGIYIISFSIDGKTYSRRFMVL
ncbi:MAG: T9SS type A sorting domain-containing protein [Cyclobacteriaceae bacterium]|nr:T9SS type A sorting domain-containing protein [Cyclobacteriaceae bacterium]